MKNDSGIILLAGLLILCAIIAGVREGLVTRDTIVLALAVIGGFIVVFYASIITWFGWAYLTFSREEKEKGKEG